MIKEYALSGSYDASNKEELRRVLAQAANFDSAVFDLSKVVYMDSAAVAMFAQLGRNMHVKYPDPYIVLLHPTPGVERKLRSMGIDKLIEIIPFGADPS